MLTMRGLVKSYGDHVALDGVDLDARAGEVTAILGPNGAGKSTLLSIVAGLRKPDAGSVEFDGLDLLNRSDRVKAKFGFAPQDTGVYPILTVRQNLEFFADLIGVRRSNRDDVVSDAARRTQVDGLMSSRVRTLSGGQKRRVHTAIALLNSPMLLMLDEPSVGADVETRRGLLDVVRETAAAGRTVLYTSHYLPEVEQLGARVIILDQGKVLAAGSIRELVDRYQLDAVELEVDEHQVEDLERLLSEEFVVHRTGGSLRVEGTSDLGRVLDRAGSMSGVRNVRSVQPSLENTYLAILDRPHADAPQ